MIIALWLVILSMQHQNSKKFGLVGCLVLLFLGIETCYNATLNYAVFHTLLYWAKLLLILGLGGYVLWVFRKEPPNE